MHDRAGRELGWSKHSLCRQPNEAVGVVGRRTAFAEIAGVSGVMVDRQQRIAGAHLVGNRMVFQSEGLARTKTGHLTETVDDVVGGLLHLDAGAGQSRTRVFVNVTTGMVEELEFLNDRVVD